MKIETFGRNNEETLKKVKELAKKLDIKTREVYLCFARNEKDARRYYEKFSGLETENLDEQDRKVYEKIISIPITGGFLPKDRRKPNLPPVILVIKQFADEETLLDEIAHLKEEEMGWRELNIDSLKEAINFSSQEPYELFFLHRVSSYISNFFADEIKCQYGCSSLLYSYRKNEFEEIKKYIKKQRIIPSKKEIKKYNQLDLRPIEAGLSASFGTTLPSSFSGNKEKLEKELEDLIYPIIDRVSSSVNYRKLKSTIKSIKIPPTKTNLDPNLCKIF